MNKHTINAIKKACPLPVIETKKLLESLPKKEEGVVEVLVDNKIAIENLIKLVTKKNLQYKWDQKDDIYTMHIFLGDNIEIECDMPTLEDTVVVIDTDFMGQGDPKLGAALIKGFIYALTETEKLPNLIILYNKGVFLSTIQQETIADLQKLEQKGVEIISCGACLTHYELIVKVGRVTNMYEIVERQTKATKIIKV
ncbi:MAG: hypothetical protein BEN19_08240 [Epulopiscium sp. Nuni2H_MBin003]|nr:MAG: hypothetical protein BEN19_08240 [Epulopiscium sp. Nuni2H_MBin003]